MNHKVWSYPYYHFYWVYLRISAFSKDIPSNVESKLYPSRRFVSWGVSTTSFRVILSIHHEQSWLFFGFSLVSAMNPELLAEYKVTHIVSILPHYPSTGPHHLTISLDDSHFANLLMHFSCVCDFIDEAVAGGGVVFVHCQMGISRSASCVIAYCEY